MDLELRMYHYILPEPILSGSSSPVSILANIVLEHFKYASSTLSPVLALVSKNIRSFSCANLKNVRFNPIILFLIKETHRVNKTIEGINTFMNTFGLKTSDNNTSNEVMYTLVYMYT